MVRFISALIVSFSLLLNSCTGINKNPILTQEEEQTDLACAYFYFLWGTHAEFSEHYPEAFEAYEKALICDPHAAYVKEKIPVILLRMGEFNQAADWLAVAIEEYPENSTYRLLLANLYIQQERVEEAIDLYNEVLRQDPNNESVYLRLGFLYTHLDEHQIAENIFRQLLEINSESYFGHLSLARLLKQTGKYFEAVDEYEAAMALNWSKELAFELGHLYSTQELYEKALLTYTTITDHDQFDERAALSRIQTLLDLDRTTEALEELETIRSHSQSPAKIDLIISKVLLRNNELDRARIILSQVVEKTGDSEARYMLALLAFQEEEFVDALSYLDKIRAEDDEFEEAVYLKTRIYQKLGNSDEAIILLQKYIELEESRSPLFYALLSSFYQAEDENQKALAMLEEAINLYGDNQQLLFEYGLLLEKNGFSQEAVATMHQLLELEPDHAEALNFIGYTWADQNVNLKKALEYISRAAELKPDNGFIIDSLGWVYFRLGKSQKAIRELERSLELEPDDPHIHEHLGDVYRSLKKFDRARESYERAYEKFIDVDKKSAIQQKIESLEH
ncbi:MAG: tetratricopeptide repeat protein [Desulforhopalus sp.]